MNLYETIFKRRSVRTYDKTPLEENTLNKVKEYLKSIPQLSGMNAELEVVCSGEVTDNHAPHYITVHCENNFAQYINVGYTLQQADLYLQSTGLGSLWLGIAKLTDSKAMKNYAIMMAFGKTPLPLRNSADEFKRLSVSEISNEDNAVANAVRLAPSAMNSQPWKLLFEGKVTLSYFGRGAFKAILKKTKSKIDLGIATRHAEIALINEGKKITSITPVGNDKAFAVEIRYE